MKIKTSEITDEHSMLSCIILNCFNQEAEKKLPPRLERQADYEYDIKLTFEGVELDIRRFSLALDRDFTGYCKEQTESDAKTLFEKWKHKYESNNSCGKKLSKLKDQLHKVRNQLDNIYRAIETLDGIK